MPCSSQSCTAPFCFNTVPADYDDCETARYDYQGYLTKGNVPGGGPFCSSCSGCGGSYTAGAFTFKDCCAIDIDKLGCAKTFCYTDYPGAYALAFVATQRRTWGC
jgi:hypothetical protein